MNRTIYILCSPDERDLPEVQNLCKYLDENNCVYYFSTAYSQIHNEPSTYNRISEVDVFIAIIGDTCDSGSAYHTELWLAWDYCYKQNLGKPKIFGVAIGDHKLPCCSEELQSYIHYLPDEKTGYAAIINS